MGQTGVTLPKYSNGKLESLWSKYAQGGKLESQVTKNSFIVQY